MSNGMEMSSSTLCWFWSTSPFPWNKVTNFNATLPTAPDRLDSNDPALPLVLCSLLQREFAMKSPGRSRKGAYKDE